jgi:hypothetical protein
LERQVILLILLGGTSIKINEKILLWRFSYFIDKNALGWYNKCIQAGLSAFYGEKV